MEKEIGKLPKNDQTDIVIRIDDFGGKRGLTIREFVTSDRYTGFTKAGTRISPENFQKFKEMINSISDEDMTQPEEDEESEIPKEQSTLNNSEKVSVEKPGQDKNLPDY